MRDSRAVLTALVAAAAWGVAGLARGEAPGALIGAACGLLVAAISVVLGVRAVVTVALAAAGAVGFILGGNVVAVLCAPAGCAGLEWAAASVTGLGAMVGVGVVVALAIRSFDEYRDATQAGRAPPSPGCEADETTGPT